MSLEKNIARIADALEKLCDLKAQHLSVVTQHYKITPEVADVPTPPPAPKQEPVAPPAPVAEAPAQPAVEAAPPAPPVAAAPAAQMTAEELNTHVVEEFKRIGDRDAIMTVFTKYGANGVSDLAAENYGALLADIRSL